VIVNTLFKVIQYRDGQLEVKIKINVKVRKGLERLGLLRNRLPLVTSVIASVTVKRYSEKGMPPFHVWIEAYV
jgi:hypothetical protein